MMAFFLAMFVLFMHPCTSANHHFLLTTALTTPRAVIPTTNHTGTTNILTSRSQHCNPASTLPTKNQPQSYRPHTHPPQSQRRRLARHTPRPLLSHLRHGAAKSRKQYRTSTVHPQLPTYLATTLFASPLFIKPGEPRPGNGESPRLPSWFSSPIISPSFVRSIVPSPTPLSLPLSRARA
jgi:hypothetical protein